MQLGGRLVELYQQLVVLADEGELQVLYLLVRHYGSGLFLVDVRLDNVEGIDEQVVAYGNVRRCLRLRVELVAYLALVVQIDFPAVEVGHRLDVVVLLTLLAVEAQVGQQAILVALRTLRGVGVEERLRQCLCEEEQFIDVTLQRRLAFLRLRRAREDVAAGTDERIAAADTAQAIGAEAGAQFLVNIDVSHVAPAVHRHGVMVPLVVAPVARYLCGKTI